MEGLGTLIIVVVGIALVCVLIWAYLHHKYVKSLEAKGWSYDGSPGISTAYGLNVAPFGVGFERKVTRAVTGNASDATPFVAFDYRSTNWDSYGFVLTMPLPHSLPPAELPKSAPVRTGDAAYAAELESALAPARGHGLTVDHDKLVLLDAPTDADGLEQALIALTAARTALLASPAAERQGPPPPPQLSFAGHPDWVYVPRDDDLLDQIDHSGAGTGHAAHDIITSDNSGLPFIRLRHTWQTQTTHTDSEGRTHTTTHHHAETLCEFRTSFPFIDLASNWGWFGRSQRFEWEEFNDRFRIESSNERVAHAVLHQRQMEYLMEVGAPDFAIGGDGRIRVKGGDEWLPDDILAMDHFLRGFFARVPDFVWKDLGAWPRPIPQLEWQPTSAQPGGDERTG